MRAPSLAFVCMASCLAGGTDECPTGRRVAPAPQAERSTPSSTPAPTTSPRTGDEPNDPGLSLEEDARNVPGPPGRVDVAHHDGWNTVEWQGTADDTIGGYEVYRKCGGTTWEKVGFVGLRKDDPRNRRGYAFEERHDAVCRYTVAAVTPAGDPGPRTVDIQ